MFPFFEPTSLPLSLDQNGNPDASPFCYPIANNDDQTFDYDFDDILDNYQFLIDPPSYQDSIYLDVAHVSTSEQTNKDNSCLVFTSRFSNSEQNPLFQEMTTTDAITYKDYSCLDIEAYFSLDEQNPVIEQKTTNGSRSTTSHNSSHDPFLSQPNDFHIDEVMRERAHAGLKTALRMKTTLEVVDDGYKWRKYGKKKVKTNPYPRNYFKCSTAGCIVKKRIERDRDDSRYVITTYDGVHNHKGYFS